LDHFIVSGDSRFLAAPKQYAPQMRMWSLETR
jgi:hypothetical protein